MKHRIIYDTGQGRSLRMNAQQLRIDLSAAEALVVSHGHSDHTGGIAQVIASGFRGRLYAHPAALLPKFQGTRTPHRPCCCSAEVQVSPSRAATTVKIITSRTTLVTTTNR